jgi:Ni/Co efflux regulator RcnB
MWANAMMRSILIGIAALALIITPVLAQTDQAAQFKKTQDARKKADALKKKIEKRAAERSKKAKP